MNQFLGFFFPFINKKLHFFLKTQKEVSVYHNLTQGRRKNKEKKEGKKGIREGMRQCVP